jgi:hypothetical protein
MAKSEVISLQVPIVLIGRFRYANARVMGVGHDWAEDNADLSWVAGLTKVDTFHIAPDMGMAVYYFKETEQAKSALPELKKFFHGYAEMFDCKITWELGTYNVSLSQKLTKQAVDSQ